MADQLRIVVGSDDAGYDYKEVLKKDLEANDGVASVTDVGVAADGHTAYPHVAVEAAPDRASVSRGVSAATEAILEFGATVGDKTMVDVLVPFDAALSAAVDDGADLATAWATAAEVAVTAAAATADLLPKMGRARPHAEKSLGTPDAGATSLGLITRAVGRVLAPQPAA